MGKQKQGDSEKQKILEVDKDKKAEQKAIRKGILKKIANVLFAQVGSCLLVLAYSIGGGYLFSALESENEKFECQEKNKTYIPVENSSMDSVYQIVKAYGTDISDSETKENAFHDIQMALEEFASSAMEIGYTGTDCDMMGKDGGTPFAWNFYGSLLFAVTIITSIGYGNICPVTYYGRLISMVYATLGIPIMLICLANIGDVMADIFKYVYANLCCCGCCKRKRKLNETPDPDVSDIEQWKKQMKNGPIVIEDDEEEEDEEFNVPLTITMAVLSAYILMGAVLYGYWEGWSELNASYFCFVTISTIGFGDMVPGADAISSGKTDANDKIKMILSSGYILLGLALLAMCLSLIQEEIAGKFAWIGEKLGIVKPDEEEEEDDDNKSETSEENKVEKFNQTD